MVKVKICGITNVEDALASVKHGADALGFVFYPKSPRSVEPETAKSIVKSLPPFVTSVGVFVDEARQKIEEIISYVGLDIIQLHGSEPPEHCNLHKKAIKAIRVKELPDLEILESYKSAYAFLLDTYSSESFGGTGQTFNWEIAVEAKKFGNIILAGGLTPDNIEQAIKVVTPYGVDVSSGVEGTIKGEKDHAKVKLFIERAKKIP
jgi:phosphoribosylanthranilate isomerase